MRKLIASMNLSLDGNCDHTLGVVNEEVHQHFVDLLRNAGALIYGRTTFQLMESAWPGVVKNPTGNKATDEFAVLIDNIDKIVYSRTLKKVDWRNTTLKNEFSKDDILKLKQQPGKDIYVGSPSMIATCAEFGLFDEYHINIHPVIGGSGLVLFKNLKEKIDLKLIKTKTASNGVVFFYYEPTRR